ncbi:MAG: hypothetical protein IPP33_00395 [Flavobacteriales bacterium]|nr:hypothetical protein [Flavobacteriales bacterium]
MEPKSKMVAEARLFTRLGVLSFAGMAFYYAHLFFGLFDNVFLFRALAIIFMVVTLPLPIIAFNNKKLFPAVQGSSKTMLNWATILLFTHHFLMTFIFVMFLQSGKVF